MAALRLAAGNGRPDVIDQLVAAGTPVDGLDNRGSTALHEGAFYGRAASVRRLLERGADPNLRDATHDGAAHGWCRYHHAEIGESPEHDAVEAVLEPLTNADERGAD